MECLNGIVESIVFKSDDTGYVVSKVRIDKDCINAVGIVPFLKEGQHVKLKGQWVLHKQFGRQFNIDEYEEVLPDSIDGIKKYLSTGIIHGIGPITAKKIVDRFKEETLDILENHIERLQEIEGIGEKKFRIIYESYIEQKDLKDIIIYFQGHGMTTNQCIKIYKKFGVDAKAIVSENPYILCDEISGIGFITADRIAKSLGIESISPFRIQSGIRYILNQFSASGNTYMPKNNLIDEVSKILGVPGQMVEENLYNLALETKIKIEKINDIEAVFSLPYYYCELGVTNKIITLSIENFRTINTDVEFEIETFERKNKIKFANSQREAIVGAFENGIEIITGGPGTGKTTIIKSIIEIYENNGMKVLLGAPTGRAAKRMTESTGREAKTIHRLLEMGVSEDENSYYGKGESEPLEADVIIIDEASMIDIMLMHSLLKAIKLGTRLIIVGDVDQLPSVGAGNVLKDLIESNFIKVVRLKDIFRQGEESLIVTNAHKINNGEMPYINRRDGDFFFENKDNVDLILSTIIDLINRRLPNFKKAWDKYRDIQILTPTRKGILGVQNLNNKLQEVLNPKSPSKREKELKEVIFREGDKVMQTKNNYSLKWIRVNGSGENEGVGVFNGDMGFIQSINEEEKTITIIFDDERKVVYDYIYLDELELAYAITIHKSQGSEFKVIITPAFMGSPLLMNKNLLYTAITRAKELVVVVGIPKALKYMVSNTRSMERYSSLRDRIIDITSQDVFSE
ncbi:ATP-dependent RecD-like DNA helicase [Clostridium tertium]|jgi:exodeoxyribonuclease V alpha subunit|uniref:SF1B family DNA helicase RecD2 n=2 Tax=Clostridiaceae TaxID=31979 RepID=UPI00019B0526|nr:MULTISPECIES: ATP-dependent RecD-like DNA helicase [Clostridium]EEH99221.1 RecD/TraA family helicase [Clostridium sp. 7_2_43FAA]MBS5307276.1 ATP-dependent RecD-like DNA helicase [Clostridium sp.]MBS6500891.1 ATP-dependent RecD-like DNA helicase [Clostridium sp.]MDB1921560.1 ATP-dependent RecD-like DNA helicase [Clostridium tertium]MDB1924804.1 ATP-dependent RecD-like DNA helicase [Clostridium tertium]